MAYLESSGWLSNVDEDMCEERPPSDGHDLVLETVESIKLKPPGAGVQQLRSGKERLSVMCVILELLCG